jgi:hypothetical protein
VLERYMGKHGAVGFLEYRQQALLKSCA